MSHSSTGTTAAPESSSQSNRAVPEQAMGGSVASDNMNQTDDQPMDQLSLSVTKLSLRTAKDDASETATDDLPDKQNGSGDSFSEGQTSTSPANGEQLTDSEVIVGNQNADDSPVNKELQAILQWMVASHLNVPNLTFINENDNELAKLPLLAEKAGKKAYTVGDILQEVKKYFLQQQMEPTVGSAPSCGLLDWLLANL
ncbi:Hypothetical predicted protein [Podarcis lilfordi]|uniref:A-kinase anchor 110kDa C-terminal domain-containing protein n=1 Tax=Podarcis lilfordi TaxID=74358 RepID=A0AA35JZI9_9SAUR|nr:Hypothetical predicted protein [Podarcis lilfordi]